MKLYFAPGACSLAPHITLLESGSAFTLEKVDTARHLTAAGVDYYSINPKGQVPFLVLDDGSTLSEGPVICQYIADKASNTKLMPPAGSLARYRVMEWQNYITSELHKSFGPLFNAAFDAGAKKLHAALLRKKFEWVDSKLVGSSYLTGEEFTVADAYLFTVAGWSKYVALDLSDLGNLQRYLARVAARPAVSDALKAEGLPA
ncbi:MAG TPA: glutathione transferase GstA [Polaromonas sp.]|uniref:glutathione transferase GstA n=1 Tax=Polaromonas sp. TaxID=1869339 RepID=UPI002D6109A9|nr:glutathione transferase GstA [Polaromonas sp.]HYW56645.1 glutathione transferase GstA [Polaromonas sp.]